MRTKALILSALVCAGGLSSALAQTTNVYSVNAVGYINLAIPSGLSMIANQLNTTNNTLASLVTNLSNFSNAYRWTGTGFDIATFIFGAWDKPTFPLNPGQGLFINTDTATTLTLVGEVPQGPASNLSVSPGLSLVSSPVPQAGPVDTLGLVLGTFDNLYKWNGSGYVIYTQLPGGGWNPSTPQLRVGESFFLNLSSTTTWTRNFTVNQ